MNLYKIKLIHIATKSTGEGILTYLLAEDDVQVYHYIDDKYKYNCWQDKDMYLEDGEELPLYDMYDEDNNFISSVPFQEAVLHEKGDTFIDDYSDIYYGIKQYAWELVEEDIDWDPTKFIELGIIDVIKS